MMSSLAQFRDDSNGSLLTTGTSTAYTVTTNSGLATVPNDGQFLRARVHTNCGASPTLAADGGTAFPILTAVGVPVTTNVLVGGSPYGFTFSVSNSAWLMNEFFTDPAAVPVGGTIVWWAAALPGSAWFWCNGAVLSAATHPALALVLGSSGGNITLPDMREVSPMGLAGMGGTGGRGLMSFAGFNVLFTVFGEQNHQLSLGELAFHVHVATLNDPSHEHQATIDNAFVPGGFPNFSTGGGHAQTTLTTGGAIPFGGSGVNTGIQFVDGLGNVNQTQGAGSNAVHNTTHPIVTCSWIIRVL
jgi:microcystin-dependent protein